MQVTGQTKVARYYPLFERAFNITKRLITEQCPLTDELRKQVLASKDLPQLYGVMKRDFWYVSMWWWVVTSLPVRVCSHARLLVLWLLEPQGCVAMQVRRLPWAGDGRHPTDDCGRWWPLPVSRTAHEHTCSRWDAGCHSFRRRMATSSRFEPPELLLGTLHCALAFPRM